MWQFRSHSISSPGRVWTLTAIWFDIVPDGTNTAASLPSRSATTSSSRLTVGSSPKTSSPTSAAFMAARMPAVGRVTVSLRRSIIKAPHWLAATRSLRSGARATARALLRRLRVAVKRSLLLLILQKPAVAELLEVYLARRALERGGGEGV